MSFDERNAQWDGHMRAFVQTETRGTAPRLWQIEIVGNKIHTSWGQLGGAMQVATEVMPGVNVGKSNEKSPEQYALERARETARKKAWDGYREVGCFPTGELMTLNTGELAFLDTEVSNEIDFDNLPQKLSFYKPDNTMSATMEKKAEEGKVWYARKRNGLMYCIAKGSGLAKLYSRKMYRQHDDEKDTKLTWDDRFPGIRDAADFIMPPNSILLGELVVDRNGADDMAHAQSLTKSLTQQSWEDQMAHGPASFYIWDIAFWKGENLVKNAPVRVRYELIHELDYHFRKLIPVQFFTVDHIPTPAFAVDYCKQQGWEGFVCVDPDGVYGDKGYNFKGKPDRPGQFCAKLKPTYEDDFVAYWDPDKGWGERSTKARNNQGIKSVALFQYNKQGQLIYISNVSSGLSDDQKRDWATPMKYPQVWKVEYKDRRYMSEGDDTNAMDFAAFVEERTDKKPEECINEKL